MQNEEYFRLYALWTFGISWLYMIIYLIFFLSHYRMVFFVVLAVIAFALFAYWFRDGGVKQGWSRLDDGLLIVFVLALVGCVSMIIASFFAIKALGSFPQQYDLSNILYYCYRVSPVVITLLNLFNLLVFLARN